jgi:hypothetical protein
MLANCVNCHDLPNTILQNDPWHYLSCNSVKRTAITNRHDSIVNNVARFTNFAGGLATVEVSGLSDQNRLRPDIQISVPEGTYMTDVKVVHPGCPTYVEKFGATQLGAAKAGEKEKVKKYSQLAEQHHAEFIPFVIETSGGFSKHSEQLLNHIITTCAEHQQLWEPRDIRRELLGAIAISTQKGNASAIFEGLARSNNHIARMESALPTPIAV